MNTHVSQQQSQIPNTAMSSGMSKTIAIAKNYTFEQKELLNANFKLVAFVPVNTAFFLEDHIVQEKDYKDGNLLYIPQEFADEEDQKNYGTKYAFFIFINGDKYVRKRIEKLLKRKLEWHVYEFKEEDREHDHDDN